MPRTTLPEHNKRDDALFVFFILALSGRVWNHDDVYRLGIEYLTLVEDRGLQLFLDYSGSTSGLRRQAIKRALVQAMHYRLMVTYADKYQVNITPRVAHRLTNESETLTQEELSIARQAAQEVRTCSRAAT